MRMALLLGSVLAATAVCWSVVVVMGWGLEGYVALCVSASVVLYGLYALTSRHFFSAVAARLEAAALAGEELREEDDPFAVPQWQWGGGQGPLPDWVIAIGFVCFGFFFAIIPGAAASQFGLL